MIKATAISFFFSLPFYKGQLFLIETESLTETKILSIQISQFYWYNFFPKQNYTLKGI